MAPPRPLPRHAAPIAQFARSDYARVALGDTVGQALSRIRQQAIAERIVYFYVIDDEQRLRGVVPTRRLLLSPLETPIAEIMVHKVIAIPAAATGLEVCEYFVLHRLLAFPIVDDERRMIGVIDIDFYTRELADLDSQEESQDIFQLIGVHLEQVRSASAPMVFVRRFPWLLCNIAGGLACALLSGWYQETLDRVIALALFIPVVLALAESVSIQSLTLTIQSHVGRRLDWRRGWRSVRRESLSGGMLGVACGLLVAVAAEIWQGRFVGVSVFLGIALSVLTAAVLGWLVPTVLRSLQRDPKLAAGPIALALTDVATLCFYFGFAERLTRG